MTQPNMFADCDSIEQIVYQAVGAGSMCWEHVRGAGDFDPTRAAEVASDALQEIRRRAFGDAGTGTEGR